MPDSWSKKAFQADDIELGGGVINFYVTPLLSFAMIQINTYDQFTAWIELINNNHPEMLFPGQETPQQYGKCSMHIGYLTHNHSDLHDPKSIAWLGISYRNAQLIMLCGFMRLHETYVGPEPDGDVFTFAQLMASDTPLFRQDEQSEVMYVIFMAGYTWADELHRGLMHHGIPFSRCKAYSLSENFKQHRDHECNCWLECDDWKLVECENYMLPHLRIKGKDFGELNLPHLTGYAFDVIREMWVVQDPLFASFFKEYRSSTTGDREMNDSVAIDHLDSTASFLAPAIGAGIIVIDFQPLISVQLTGLGSLSTQPQPEPGAAP